MLRAGPPASARNRNGDLFDGAFGAVYSFYIRRRRLSRLIAAVVWGADVGRCLRPGGRAVGSMITRGRTARHRLLVRPGFGGFGPGGTVDDLRGWLERVGLEQVRLEVSGLFAYFEAAKPLGA